VPAQLGLGERVSAGGDWWRLVPVMERQAAYAPVLYLAVVGVVIAATVFVVNSFYHRRSRRTGAWDCGFVRLDARMQDTAEGFGQPIRNIFQAFFGMYRELPTPFDAAPRYAVRVSDRIWTHAYVPLATVVQRIANAVARLQQGRIATYLLYSFITLLVLLALVL
jgi:hydrogenase-4 component B